MTRTVCLHICALLKSGLLAAILPKRTREDNILLAYLGDILFSKCTSLNNCFGDLNGFFIEGRQKVLRSLSVVFLDRPFLVWLSVVLVLLYFIHILLTYSIVPPLFIALLYLTAFKVYLLSNRCSTDLWSYCLSLKWNSTRTSISFLLNLQYTSDGRVLYIIYRASFFVTFSNTLSCEFLLFLMFIIVLSNFSIFTQSMTLLL